MLESKSRTGTRQTKKITISQEPYLLSTVKKPNPFSIILLETGVDQHQIHVTTATFHYLFTWFFIDVAEVAMITGQVSLSCIRN